MTKRIVIAPAPEPLEAYVQHFDKLFGKSNQREEFRRYLEGLLLPSERHKTLTGLVNTEPMVGAQLPRAQKLQWFLSESSWDERAVQAERLKLLREDPATAPTADGVLVIDETGDRKDGHQTAHVGRQYLANLGKIDNGVVSVSSLWADERVYYPVDVEPYTPAPHFEKGKEDPHFRTKLKIAVELVRRAVQAQMPFRAVVADSFYGEDRGVKRGLRELGVGYVLALKPSHEWWHPIRAIGSFQEAARAGRWKSEERPGKWVQVTRSFRDGSSQEWWALEVITGPYGPHKQERVVIATTDPLTLPDLTTFYLVTNLPAPGSEQAQDSKLAAASLQEVVRLYGLRMWVEQSYKHVKHELGWSQYQVRSDKAMRRHWQLVCCAFSHLVVSCQSWRCHQRSRAGQGDWSLSRGGSGWICQGGRYGEKKAARHSTCDPRCPGPGHCAQFEDGWSPGSCCGAIGMGGPSSPHLQHCNACSPGLNRARLSHSTARLDPLSTNYR